MKKKNLLILRQTTNYPFEQEVTLNLLATGYNWLRIRFYGRTQRKKLYFVKGVFIFHRHKKEFQIEDIFILGTFIYNWKVLFIKLKCVVNSKKVAPKKL